MKNFRRLIPDQHPPETMEPDTFEDKGGGGIGRVGTGDSYRPRGGTPGMFYMGIHPYHS